MESDVSAYTGVVGISGGSTVEVDTPTELETYAGLGAYASDILTCANLAALMTLINGGDYTPTGAVDFTTSSSVAFGPIDAGSGTVEIPNGTDPDVDTTGEISYDTDDYWLRIFDGSIQRGVPTFITIPISLAEPDGMDARDYMPIWVNDTGATATVVSIYAISDDDDTDFRIEEYDADGSSNESLVKAETCDTGSGPYTNDGQTTITNPTIENGHILVFDFDDTDTPDYLHFTIKIILNGDVD